MTKRINPVEVRRKALQDARAEIRADILLERGSPADILERVTKILDRMIESGR